MTTNTAKKAGLKDWHPADIKAALEKAGWSLAELAREHDLSSSSSLSHTFTSSYPLNERRIANALGVPPQTIWPSRYYPDGTPRPRGIRALRATRSNGQSTARSSACNGKTQQAA